MEDPATWDLLTASLAVTKLERPSFAWAFLVIQGLVRAETGDQAAFAEIVRRELDQGPDSGPSVAARIAVSLREVQIGLPSGQLPDPEAAVASERHAIIARWSESMDSAQEVEHLKLFPQQDGVALFTLHCPRCAASEEFKHDPIKSSTIPSVFHCRACSYNAPQPPWQLCRYGHNCETMRLCECEAGNPLDSRYCVRCGRSLPQG